MGSPRQTGRALVAVTCSSQALRRLQDGGARELRRYTDCLERAGAQPVLVAPGQRPVGLAECRGLLLSGGVDIHPRFYGGPPDGAEKPDAARDELELALVREARQRRWPVLAICRGMQVLNVALGGSLEQDVAGHRRPGDTASARHAIAIVAGSGLARLLGLAGAVTVNSRHHQAVVPERLAPGLRAVAYSAAPPHVVEAVEAADGWWAFGVQCHPERTDEVPPEFSRLFQALVRQAAGARVVRVPSSQAS